MTAHAAHRAPIRVLVVDDHDLLREGVISCLAAFDDLEVVGESSSGEDGLAAAAELQPDVVVIDLVMPGIGGVEAIRRMREAHTSIGLLALSTFTTGELIREAIGAGASGYVGKSVDPDGLAQAVRDVAAGRGAFSADVTRALAATPAGPDSATAPLTEREAEVAELMAHGRSNAEIAEALNLSVFTVKNHVSSILMKLHAHSRTEATAIILRSR
jgi:NarL family two-component system response regulator LiaR